MTPGRAKVLTDLMFGTGEQGDRLFGAMVEALPVAIYATDAAGYLRYFNPAAVKLSGRVPEIGTDRWCVTWKLFRSDGTSLPHDDSPMAIALKGGEVPTGIECMAERPDGTRFWFAPYPVVVRDAERRIIACMNLLVELTERKNAEIQAAEALGQLRLIADNMDVGVTRCSSDLRYLWVSPTLATWFGLSPEEITGRSILDVIGQEAFESIRPHIERVLSGEREEYEAEVNYQGVGSRRIHAIYVPTRGQNHEVDGWIAVVLDITARHETEEAVRASEARLKQAQRLAKVGSWARPLQEKGTPYWSEEMIRIVGLPDGASGDFEEFLSYVHPRDREKVMESVSKIVSTGELAEAEYRIIRRDGEVRFVRSVAEPVTDSTGVIVELIGATQDITDQVKAREAVRESELRLKNAERLAKVGHWDWDLKSNQVTWSDGTFRIFGKSRDYKPSYEDLLRVTVPEDQERLNHVVTSSVRENSGFVVEFQITRPDGELRTVRSISEMSVDTERRLPLRMFGTVQDITDERRALKESIARQKWESLGRLAGGVAHDFSNLLSSALAQAELASAQLAEGSNPEGELQTIREVAIRGNEIVRQLMMYAGKENAAVTPIDVSGIIEEMVRLLNVSVSKHAKLEVHVAKDLPPIPANAAQIRQIVMNLVTNASDAIGNRDGVIRVITKYVKAGRDWAGEPGEDPSGGSYILIEVSDTGSGMQAETQTKIFEPFFTTKSTGHGFGLATVDGIVQSLGGKIHLASEPGKGTTFQILLPCG